MRMDVARHRPWNGVRHVLLRARVSGEPNDGSGAMLRAAQCCERRNVVSGEPNAVTHGEYTDVGDGHLSLEAIQLDALIFGRSPVTGVEVSGKLSGTETRSGVREKETASGKVIGSVSITCCKGCLWVGSPML